MNGAMTGTSPVPRSRAPRRRGRRRTSLIVGLTMVASSAAVAFAGTSAAAPGDLVIDSFTRTGTSGWGSADLGGKYTFADPSAFSVSDGRGIIKLPAAGQSRTADLSVSSLDQVAKASVGVAALPTSGSGVSVAVLARKTAGKAYRGVLKIKPGGVTTLAVVRVDGSAGQLTPIGSETTLAGKAKAGMMFDVELSVAGNPVAITARARPSDGSSPAAQISRTDSSAGRITGAGTFGIWTYTSSSGQSATVLVDNIAVRAPGTAPTTTGPAPSTTTAGPTTATPTSATPTTSTAPAPTGTTTPTQPGAPVPGSPDQATRYGGAPVLGSQNYPVPTRAQFVSPAGSDSAVGSFAAPFKTIAKAISVATSGQTIVLRGGTYHESVTIPTGKTLTLQPYQNEVVWLDGSSVVGTWTADGSRWRADNWTAEFDDSPTYTRGAADNTDDGWGFVDPDHPMAAHPDQVWIDGQAQQQVGSLAEVGPGEFYVDYDTNRLYLGSDPSGHTVRASDLSKAISVRSEGSVLRGFGVGRFAPSVPDMGAVTIEKVNCLVENMVFADSATTGLSLVTTDITVRNVTVTRSGMLGVHANYADRLQVSNLASTQNNTEQFNLAPVSGGFKITKSRDVTIADSRFQDNDGPGLWLDESVYDGKILRTRMIGNSGHGVSVELSAKATLVGNLVWGNGGFGMKINDTSDVRIWNNTLVDNDRPINIVQDTRRASNASTPGHDPRQKFPDPTMTWLNGPVEVRNNILSGTSGNCLLCVEDYSKERSAEQMQVTANGDVYRRASASSPTWMVVWSKGAGNPAVFTTLAAFKSATGQEAASLGFDGTAVVTPTGAPTDTVTAAAGTVATPLPADIAGLWGVGVGSRRLGAALTK